MIRKIVVDGNDGTGKTATINKLKSLFPGIEIQDRGLFSEATLNDELFKEYEEESKRRENNPNLFLNFGMNIDNQQVNKNIMNFLLSLSEIPECDTLFIICVADPEVCQQRIAARGDSIEEEYHTMEDLKKFDYRFRILCRLTDYKQNIMLVDTTNRTNPDTCNPV